MASGNFWISRTSGSNYLSFRVDWNSISNTEGNYSDITVAVYVVKSGSSTSDTWGTSNTNVTIEGYTQYENGLGFRVSPNGQTLLFAKAGYRVGHDNEGQRQISISVNVGGDVMSASGSATVQLDKIPRASSIAVGNYNLGQNLSIVIGKKSSSFTSTLSYKIGSRTGNIASRTSNSSVVWEMSIELINQIKSDNPNNKNVSATIYCETYSGDTKIGNTQQANFTLTIIDKPTISSVEIEETIDIISKYTNKIVKYLSAPKLNITSVASIGSSISKYRVRCGNQDINNSDNSLIISDIQYSYLVDEIPKTKFIINVIDARGNTSDDYELEKDFIDYVKLSFNNTDIKLTRLNTVSNKIKATIKGYIYKGLIGDTQNTLSLQYRYKLRNNPSANWSDLITINPTLNDDNTFLIEGLELESNFDYKENYDIEFYAKDLFLPANYQTIIKTSETIAKVHKNGMYIKNLDVKKLLIDGHQFNEYSTEETVVGVWHDGRPIYRKVYIYDSITFTPGEHTLNINLPNLDCVTGFKYAMWYPTLSRWYVNWDTIDAHNITITSTICRLGSSGGNTTFTKAHFVFEYTKTTDKGTEEENV